jgi:hypothetical protein
MVHTAHVRAAKEDDAPANARTVRMLANAWPATRERLRRELASEDSIVLVTFLYSAAATPVDTMTVASTGARRQERKQRTTMLPEASRIARSPRSREMFL